MILQMIDVDVDVDVGDFFITRRTIYMRWPIDENNMVAAAAIDIALNTIPTS